VSYTEGCYPLAAVPLAVSMHAHMNSCIPWLLTFGRVQPSRWRGGAVDGVASLDTRAQFDLLRLAEQVVLPLWERLANKLGQVVPCHGVDNVMNVTLYKL